MPLRAIAVGRMMGSAQGAFQRTHRCTTMPMSTSAPPSWTAWAGEVPVRLRAVRTKPLRPMTTATTMSTASAQRPVVRCAPRGLAGEALIGWLWGPRDRKRT